MEEKDRSFGEEDDNEVEDTIDLSAAEQHGSVERGMRTERKKP